MKRVVIVREGHWGELKEGDYDDLVDSYKRILEDAETTALYDRNKKEKEAKVTLVEETAEAERMIRQGLVEVVIFISRGMEVPAETIARAYPRVRVVVFSGLIPDGKVIWVSKAVVSAKAIQDIVLHS